MLRQLHRWVLRRLGQRRSCTRRHLTTFCCVHALAVSRSHTHGSKWPKSWRAGRRLMGLYWDIITFSTTLAISSCCHQNLFSGIYNFNCLQKQVCHVFYEHRGGGGVELLHMQSWGMIGNCLLKQHQGLALGSCLVLTIYTVSADTVAPLRVFLACGKLRLY